MPNSYSIPLAEVPLKSLRIASNHLQNLRLTETVSPLWSIAEIGETVSTFQRPDLSDIAYYEFELIADGEPCGFILVSTGNHDFPVAHWSDEGPSCARRLAESAANEGKTIDRMFYLDTATYLAIETNGGLAASYGNLPCKLVNYLPNSNTGDPDISETSTFDMDDDRKDAETMNPDHGHESSGLTQASFEMQEWGSIGEMLKSYATHYTVGLEHKRKMASQDWETENLIDEFGEGIAPGDTIEVPLLFSNSEYDLEGQVSEFEVQIDNSHHPEILKITSKPTQKTNVELHLHLKHPYLGGQTETLTFFSYPMGVGMIPGPKKEDTVPQGKEWKISTIYSAGTLSEQPQYNQWLTANNHYVGCGPVAWAMLIGWADRQAAKGNTYWSPRWGLYRSNGGRGKDGIAPRYMTKGIKNVISELATHLGTFKIGTDGATLHTDMWKVKKYLQGRTGTRSYSGYHPFCLPSTKLRNSVIDSIRYRKTPAVVGIGFLSSGHYPMAWEYRVRYRIVRYSFGWLQVRIVEYSKEFHLNQGWKNIHSWAPASTWYSGQLIP